MATLKDSWREWERGGEASITLHYQVTVSQVASPSIEAVIDKTHISNFYISRSWLIKSN